MSVGGETAAPSEAAPGAREEAAARGLALLARPPWDALPRDLALLLVRPPLIEDGEDGGADGADLEGVAPAYWLLIGAADARTLPPPWRDPLLRDGLRRAPADEDGGAPAELTALTAEGCAALLDAASRRSFEARWTLRHAEAVHDPRGSLDALAGAAGRVPSGALEQAARGLYLQAFAALEALPHAGAGAIVAAGEAAGAAARLACLLETGGYAPSEHLIEAARATGLGRRLRPWLDALAAAAAGGDASRAAVRAAPDALRALETALRPRFADREWLRDPARHALRLPRPS